MEKYQTLFNVLTRYGLTLTQSEMDEIADAAKPIFGYECSHSLADLLERLRKNQKDFFGAQPGSLARQTALHESNPFLSTTHYDEGATFDSMLPPLLLERGPGGEAKPHHPFHLKNLWRQALHNTRHPFRAQFNRLPISVSALLVIIPLRRIHIPPFGP